MACASQLKKLETVVELVAPHFGACLHIAFWGSQVLAEITRAGSKFRNTTVLGQCCTRHDIGQSGRGDYAALERVGVGRGPLSA